MNFRLYEKEFKVFISSVKISKDLEFRGKLKGLYNMKPKNVSTDIPEWADTTTQMKKGELRIQEYKPIDITTQVQGICTRLLTSGCIFIKKEKFNEIVNEKKLKKFGLEIVYKVKTKTSSATRRANFTKLNHSIFLCPDLEELVKLIS